MLITGSLDVFECEKEQYFLTKKKSYLRRFNRQFFVNKTEITLTWKNLSTKLGGVLLGVNSAVLEAKMRFCLPLSETQEYTKLTYPLA